MNVGKIIWGAFGIAFIILMIIVGAREGRYRFGEAVKKDGILLVPTGSDFGQLIDSLSAGDFLLHEHVFERQAKIHNLTETLKAGRYELKAGMTYSKLINMLKSGNQSPVKVTFNNIRTLDRLAGAVSKRMEFDSVTLLKYLESDSVAASYGYTPATFMAMFIPNTYELYWNATPTEFLNRMQKESDRFWTSRDAKLARTGLSRVEVITLASIVYEETKFKNEMPRVAGVYMNRLRKGMPLQADPTVKFAVNDFTLKRVLLKHLNTDSPYNTYKNAGLPPGPISMPSIDAIDAVLNYEENEYFYFCAKDDLSGVHVFAATLDEHNKNARCYVQALNSLGIK